MLLLKMDAGRSSLWESRHTSHWRKPVSLGGLVTGARPSSLAPAGWAEAMSHGGTAGGASARVRRRRMTLHACDSVSLQPVAKCKLLQATTGISRIKGHVVASQTSWTVCSGPEITHQPQKPQPCFVSVHSSDPRSELPEPGGMRSHRECT